MTTRYEVRDGVAILTLDNPPVNGLSYALRVAFAEALEKANADASVKAIVVTGAGKAFCAGMDLSVPGNVFGLDETQQPTLQDMRERLDEPAIFNGVRDTGGRVVLSIFNCKKPVIGAINGAAVGIGATMTLPMDIRLASDKARIGFVFGRIGIVPEACSSWFLPRIVGISQALEWTYMADIFDGHEAQRGGLVKAVYPADQLLDEALKIARRIASERSAVGVALTRQMMYRNSAQPHPLAAHQVDSLAMFYTSVGDGKEGVQAFLDKRPAKFESKASAMPSFYPWWE